MAEKLRASIGGSDWVKSKSSMQKSKSITEKKSIMSLEKGEVKSLSLEKDQELNEMNGNVIFRFKPTNTQECYSDRSLDY